MLSPGALEGFMKSPQPESELCPCPTVWPSCAQYDSGHSLKYKAPGAATLQLQLTATNWEYEPSAARSAEPLGKTRNYFKALLKSYKQYLWAVSNPLAVRLRHLSSEVLSGLLSDTPPHLFCPGKARALGSQAWPWGLSREKAWTNFDF